MPRSRTALSTAAAVGSLTYGLLAVGAVPSTAAPVPPVATKATPLSSNLAVAVGPSATLAASPSGCQLANGVQHVFYLGFDNFHLRRDNSNTVANNGDRNRNSDLNIPGDLEQVPALYNFLRGSSKAGTTPNPTTANNANYADGRNTAYSDGSAYPGGTVLANHHTPLISHTSVDLTTTYSGVYGDRHGVAVSQNSIAAYTGNATSPVAATSGFSYWTDPLGITGDPTTTITTKDVSGNPVNAPAPWVPFTRAGCDVGSVSTTGFVLENSKSVANAFAGTGVTGTSADTGLAVHCAHSSAVCGTSATDSNVAAVPDKLPNEPGGYSGYQALYGHRFIAPAVNDRINGAPSGGSTTVNLLRSPATSSFPGFSGEDGNYTLGYTLAMQKAGIPVTFGYLSSAHDCHSSLIADNGGSCNHTNVAGTTDSGSNSTFGSGEQGYVNYLKQLNTDFQTFFDQTKAAGYNTSNTEFVFYSDENDHTAEGTPANPTCDGVTTACQWDHAGATSGVKLAPTPGQLGEVTVKLDTPLPRGGATSYTILADSAPDFYLEQQGTSGPPSQSDPAVRTFERTLGSTTYTDPYTGGTRSLSPYEADQAGMNALHMITADSNRSPTVDVFSAGENYVESGFPSDCGGAANGSCSNAGFVYQHGDFAPETTTTWAGLVGPGVAKLGNGVDTTHFTDHVDLRPTLLALLGLRDDYTAEGRVITEILNSGVVDPQLTSTDAGNVGTMLKKIDAPNYGATETTNNGFGPAVLVSDTEAVQSSAAGDSTYTDVTSRINTITSQRNIVAADMLAVLTSAAAGTPIDHSRATTDIQNGQCLLDYANQLKAYAASPSPATAPTDCMVSSAIVPEASHSALLVLTGGVVLAAALLLGGRRRRVRTATA